MGQPGRMPSFVLEVVPVAGAPSRVVGSRLGREAVCWSVCRARRPMRGRDKTPDMRRKNIRKEESNSRCVVARDRHDKKKKALERALLQCAAVQYLETCVDGEGQCERRMHLSLSGADDCLSDWADKTQRAAGDESARQNKAVENADL
jgi:hypothetical protein